MNKDYEINKDRINRGGYWKLTALFFGGLSILLFSLLLMFCFKIGYIDEITSIVTEIVDEFNNSFDIKTSKSIVITGDSIQTEEAGLWSRLLRKRISFASYENYAIGGTCLTKFGSGNQAISSENRLKTMPDYADIIGSKPNHGVQNGAKRAMAMV